jgi:hypothetical protein
MPHGTIRIASDLTVIGMPFSARKAARLTLVIERIA